MSTRPQRAACGVPPVSIFRDTRVNYVMRRLGEATDEFFDALRVKVETLMPEAPEEQRRKVMLDGLQRTVPGWSAPAVQQRVERLLELARDFEANLHAAFAIYVKDTYAEDLRGRRRKVQVCMPKVSAFLHAYFMRIIHAPEVIRGAYWEPGSTNARNFAVCNAMLDALAEVCVENVRVTEIEAAIAAMSGAGASGAAAGGPSLPPAAAPSHAGAPSYAAAPELPDSDDSTSSGDEEEEDIPAAAVDEEDMARASRMSRPSSSSSSASSSSATTRRSPAPLPAHLNPYAPQGQVEAAAAALAPPPATTNRFHTFVPPVTRFPGEQQEQPPHSNRPRSHREEHPRSHRPRSHRPRSERPRSEKRHERSERRERSGKHEQREQRERSGKHYHEQQHPRSKHHQQSAEDNNSSGAMALIRKLQGFE